MRSVGSMRCTALPCVCADFPGRVVIAAPFLPVGVPAVNLPAH
jgi:hypothetical protein